MFTTEYNITYNVKMKMVSYKIFQTPAGYIATVLLWQVGEHGCVG